MKNAGSTLNTDESDDVQKRRRVMSARGGREKFLKGARPGPTATRSRQAELGSDSEVMRSGSRWTRQLLLKAKTVRRWVACIADPAVRVW